MVFTNSISKYDWQYLINGFSLISVIIFFSNSTFNDKKTSAIKANSILVINFSETKIVERKSENPFENLNPSSSEQKSMELKKILDNIEKAKYDKNIKAIYLNSSITSGGISQIEEIRNKLLEFKQTGKEIISYNRKNLQREFKKYVGTQLSDQSIRQCEQISVTEYNSELDGIRKLFLEGNKI